MHPLNYFWYDFGFYNDDIVRLGYATSHGNPLFCEMHRLIFIVVVLSWIRKLKSISHFGLKVMFILIEWGWFFAQPLNSNVDRHIPPPCTRRVSQVGEQCDFWQSLLPLPTLKPGWRRVVFGRFIASDLL